MTLITLGLIAAAHVLVGANAAAVAPTIVLDNGTFTGLASTTDAHSFFNIPFAQPPTGPLRFRLPTPVQPYSGTHNATLIGPACPQQTAVVPILSGAVQKIVGDLFEDWYGNKYPSAEDCLTLNIIKPANATPSAKLPVVLWLFAGGFEFGTPARYDGVPIVQRSLALGTPIIYISINYRVSAFGFLGGKEVKEQGVGNLGLHDQREALRWVQKYIGAFGGDASKVTIWGESAGAISVSLQMLYNGGNTEGLFRAAYMQSGSPVPVGPIDTQGGGGQKYYDALVARTNCSSTPDTLECLRGLPYDQLKAAQDASPFFLSYESLVLAWLPRVDGVFLSDNPQRLVQQGKVADVPFITGDCDDEGTIFSLSTLNVTTDADFTTYLSTIWAPTANASTVKSLTDAYPSALSEGSPFGTGIFNALSPQFKRLASFQGDAVFHAPRRFFQQALSGKQNQWAYLNKRYKAVPFLGSFHTTDVFNVYETGELTDYLVNFVTALDPNGPTVPAWPAYTTEQPNLMTFADGLGIGDGRETGTTAVTQDTFREEAIRVLTEVSLEYPI
ncbi:Alpha/Beta hydrolase protein [Mycena albidolilacea]|uniref:Carboxylic ester hydrolase n=1 Tax=Mycena albidolilacea TaxID=1033008 RepID=A0AAD7APY9_9AGAR|nr:Alpha/Beta hydrolase protein [Mycena albidolilacea]